MASESEANGLFIELSGVDLEAFSLCFWREDSCNLFFQAFLQFIREGATVESLGLSMTNAPHAISADAFQSICDAIRTSSTIERLILKDLHIQGNSNNNQRDILVDTIIRSNRNLRQIHINSEGPGSFSIDTLSQALHSCLHAQDLDLIFMVKNTTHGVGRQRPAESIVAMDS